MGAVCLGLTNLDLVQRVSNPPEIGRKQVVESTELCAGGPAANAAVTAAALLGECTLITGLGASPAAELCRADLTAHGVRVLDLAPAGWQLPTSACVITPDGERTVFSQSALGSRLQLSDRAREALAYADALLLDGHHPVAAGMAIGLVADGDCVTLLDAGSVKPAAESWLSWLDVVAGSADYASGLGTDLDGALAHVLDAGATAAVMTDGPREVIWCHPTGAGRVVPPSVEAIDTLGAGDAFHGALLAGLLTHDGDLGEAVQTAVVTASKRVTTAGSRSWLAQLKV